MTHNPWAEWHGHVHPRPDGFKARCDGPTLCKVCHAEWRRAVERQGVQIAERVAKQVLQEEVARLGT